MEEEVFYPRLRDEQKARDSVLEGYEEHHVADVILDELLSVLLDVRALAVLLRELARGDLVLVDVMEQGDQPRIGHLLVRGGGLLSRLVSVRRVHRVRVGTRRVLRSGLRRRLVLGMRKRRRHGQRACHSACDHLHVPSPFD